MITTTLWSIRKLPSEAKMEICNMYNIWTKIWTIEGGQKNVLLRRTNIYLKKSFFMSKTLKKHKLKYYALTYILWKSVCLTIWLLSTNIIRVIEYCLSTLQQELVKAYFKMDVHGCILYRFAFSWSIFKLAGKSWIIEDSYEIPNFLFIHKGVSIA